MKADRVTVDKLELFNSENRRYHFSNEICESWSYTVRKPDDAELLENIYGRGTVGMESDAWLLYYTHCMGASNIASISNLNKLFLSMEPELKVFDFCAIRSEDKKALRTRLNELVKAGMLMKINYMSYYPQEYEDKKDGRERTSAIYFPTKLGTTFLNQKLNLGRKAHTFAASEPIPIVLGKATSALVMSKMLSEVYAKNAGNSIFFDEHIYRSRSEGVYHLDAHAVVTYADKERVPDYIAFVNGNFIERSSTTGEEFKRSIKRKISVICDFVRNRTSKGRACVVCAVDGKQGLLSMIKYINASGFTFDEEISSNVYFTSEGCVNELGSVGESLFCYNQERDELRNVECFY